MNVGRVKSLTRSEGGRRSSCPWRLIGGVLILAFAVEARAQQENGASGEVAFQARIAECAQIEDDGSRLACFDRALSAESAIPAAAGALEANEAQSSPNETPPDRHRPAERQDEPRSTTIVIAEVRRTSLGGISFVTDNGELYDQQSARSGRYPSVPFEAILRPAASDTYFLESPMGGPAVRVSLRR